MLDKNISYAKKEQCESSKQSVKSILSSYVSEGEPNREKYFLHSHVKQLSRALNTGLSDSKIFTRGEVIYTPKVHYNVSQIVLYHKVKWSFKRYY